MTPSDIEVLLHYHCSPTPHPRASTPAVKAATNAFRSMGLIHLQPDFKSNHRYETTEGGKILVEALCAVPFPVKRWTMPTDYKGLVP